MLEGRLRILKALTGTSPPDSVGSDVTAPASADGATVDGTAAAEAAEMLPLPVCFFLLLLFGRMLLLEEVAVGSRPVEWEPR